MKPQTFKHSSHQQMLEFISHDKRLNHQLQLT